MNEDLIKSAVGFLKDPNVASSPLTKKVEFLESKGLNQNEVEEALRRANGSAGETNTSTVSNASSNNNSHTQMAAPPIDYYNISPPDLPERSWKDYFIMATATAGVSYGLYQVISRYLVPAIIPPSQSSIEEDKNRIDEEFMKVDKVLEQLTKEQEEVKSANEQKLKEIDVVIDNVNDFLSKYNKDKLKFDDDMRLMKLEIDNLKNSVEKNLNLTKENLRDDLQDINEELNSLKQLIKTRAEKGGDSSNVRKIAPVSSIPSASEILKKAKPKNDSIKSSPEFSAPTTFEKVTAAGIPEWQMKHKSQEEQQQNLEPASGEKTEESEQSFNVQTSDPTIPSWQLNSNTNDDDVVKESIKNVGVPSWQLNSTSTSI
ncbi:uncharacterized protein PRCAT00000420001 [Priceomyces carsonii]|uniref:uncharacterized protein n=1 Tax=Priceomyces carsonii TaxID=28549 RepID=UPI002EDB7042|nr:unnamed protein product [Priceomyces carsonii]